MDVRNSAPSPRNSAGRDCTCRRAFGERRTAEARRVTTTDVIGPLPPALAECRLVEHDGHGRPSAATDDAVQRGREPAEVVGMAVAEEDGLDLALISPEVGDVVAQ